jgi:hypothetical protein
MSHYVTIPTFYFVVDQTIADLNNILPMSFRFNDAEYLQNNSDGFSRFRRSPLTGCAGAIDGIAIRIQEPARGSLPNLQPTTTGKEFSRLQYNLCVIIDTCLHSPLQLALDPLRILFLLELLEVGVW